MNSTPAGQEPQLLTRQELKRLLQERRILDKVHSHYYRPVVESNKPATEPGGRKLIVSYYDGNRYVCTKHRVIVGVLDSVEEVHQDVEAAVIDGIRHERLPD